MDDRFSQSLAEWNGFYALLGGAAATLLGLLFVAVSLRLNIFHQRNVADVRAFALFVLGMFLAAIVVAGLALAPHERRGSLAVAVLIVGAAGLLALIWVIRIRVRLNRSAAVTRPGFTPGDKVGWASIIGMGGACVAVIADALLLWSAHPAALGWLAVIEGWLLVMGTTAAWLMLSHAGGPPDVGVDVN